jgi:hypothetical protein
MSENVEIVRRLIEAWNRNEQERVVPVERVVPFLDPGVIFDATRRIINPKTYAGIEGIRAMLAERDEVWGEFRMEPDEFVDAGDRVVVIGRWVGKGQRGRSQPARGRCIHAPWRQGPAL